MPRNVRNFWLRLLVDGKKAPVETGPRSADGGFSLKISMRRSGEIAEEVVYVQGRVGGDGVLHLYVVLVGPNGQQELAHYVTDR